MITNRLDNKRYIGFTIKKRPEERAGSYVYSSKRQTPER